MCIEFSNESFTMITMSYDLSRTDVTALIRPAFEAGAALTRLDERIARSPVGSGFLERMQFLDACASLWIDGALVHLEDLVLHDGLRDIRTPTHELTISHDVLHTADGSRPETRAGRCPPMGYGAPANLGHDVWRIQG